ncbi:MAG: hypothetical protein H6546_06450 [Chitinophagales bacterium]|nr:hypothetical protein [Ignavibacteriota bacterium]MCB9019951.1 hypothetical protein [Chitinophagales bacterium]
MRNRILTLLIIFGVLHGCNDESIIHLNTDELNNLISECNHFIVDSITIDENICKYYLEIDSEEVNLDYVSLVFSHFEYKYISEIKKSRDGSIGTNVELIYKIDTKDSLFDKLDDKIIQQRIQLCQSNTNNINDFDILVDSLLCLLSGKDFNILDHLVVLSQNEFGTEEYKLGVESFTELIFILVQDKFTIEEKRSGTYFFLIMLNYLKKNPNNHHIEYSRLLKLFESHLILE